MAKKKPLVLTNGQWEQLQSTDYIGDISLLSLTNGEAGSLVIGAPVYCSAADTVKKAKADASGTMPVMGLVVDATITTGVSGSIQTDGVLAATTTQWDTICGTSGGLTPNTRYYLSAATAGLLTSTPPTSGYVQEVGIAISTTEMLVAIKSPIKL